MRATCWNGRLRAYLLLGTEPWADGAQPQALVDAGKRPLRGGGHRLRFAGHAGGRASAAASGRLRRDFGHLCESRGSLAEFCRSRPSAGRGAAGVEDPAGAGQSARPARFRLPVLGTGARRVAGGGGAGAGAQLYGRHLRPPPSAQVESLRDVPMYQLDPVLRRATRAPVDPRGPRAGHGVSGRDRRHPAGFRAGGCPCRLSRIRPRSYWH